MSPVARKLCIDLTLEVEHCAICSIELGEGSGKAGLVYVLKDCRCVCSYFQYRITLLMESRSFAVSAYSFPVVCPFFLANMPTT